MSVLPALDSLTLLDNPIRDLPEYRLNVLARLPKLKKIDKELVTEDEQEKARVVASDQQQQQPIASTEQEAVQPTDQQQQQEQQQQPVEEGEDAEKPESSE